MFEQVRVILVTEWLNANQLKLNFHLKCNKNVFEYKKECCEKSNFKSLPEKS